MKNKFSIGDSIATVLLERKRADERGPKQVLAIIDRADLERVQEFTGTWYTHWDPVLRSFYVHGMLPRVDGKQRLACLHRWIFGLDTGDKRQVDHIRHDTLDNRRANLRVVTDRENKQNWKSKSEMSSRFPGVCWDKAYERWRSKIRIKQRQMFLGLFDDESEASDAYLSACHNLLVPEPSECSPQA